MKFRAKKARDNKKQWKDTYAVQTAIFERKGVKIGIKCSRAMERCIGYI